VVAKPNNEEETMAYSDYGGYAYRNGKRVEDRSDATISPDGDVFGSPGIWPGFAAYAAGGKDEYEKRREWPSGHAVATGLSTWCSTSRAA
jgi:hypothetical protein